jgi:outer membrane biosynthesis protein TonB
MAQKLTLRTLLAYIDDTLEPAVAAQLGAKVQESELARELIEKIKRVTRRRGLKAPSSNADDDGVSDPNTVAEYLSNSLESEQVTRLEETCLESDSHLAEVAACHQILTLILTEPVRVPPKARERMYKLVPPPASTPVQRKKKPQPVGSVMPEAAEQDDADAAYLLGFARFGGSSMMQRVAAVAGVVALTGLLIVAAIMSLPGHQPEPPPVDSRQFVQGPPVVPVPPVREKDQEPEKKPVEPEKKPDDMPKKEVEVAPPPKKVDLAERPAAPKMDRGLAGKADTVNTIIVTRTDEGPAWLRLDPADESAVSFADQVLALPGFKGDIQLDTGAKVHLWGNVPELLPSRLLESRVRFHAPERKVDGKGEDFDADLTLIAGRIYVGTKKAAGSRVRIRFSNQVWDVTLTDAASEFTIEVVTSFDPGTPFAKEGGALPRVEVQAAVVRGTATISIPERFKTFAKVPATTALAWDSKSATLGEPKPVEKGNTYFDRFMLVDAAAGKAVEKAKTDMATRLKTRDGVNLMLLEVLTEPPAFERIAASQLAAYGQAAIVTDADGLKPLVDLLFEETKGYARLATVNALAGWIAQSPGNTATLLTAVTAKVRNDQDPEIIVRLLRGAVAREPDKLVELLSNSSVAVRELALWNLVNFVDQSSVRTPALITDVAQAGTPAYEKFVKAWKTRVEELKMKK